MDPLSPQQPAPDTQPLIPVPPPPTKQTYLKYIIILILFFVIGTSAYLLGSNNAKPVAQLPRLTPTQAPEPTIDPLADWKVYTGDGFTFKYYPSDILKEEANFTTWDSLYQDGSMRQNMFLVKLTAAELKPTVGSQISVGMYSFRIENIENGKKIMLGNKEANYYTISCGVHCYYGVVDFETQNNTYRLIHNFAGGGLSSSFEKIFPTFSFTDSETLPVISNEEKQQIDAWIKINNLNEYGDQKNISYIGGTPLFNEMTGETIDRYEYILSKNPTRPWNK